MLDIVVLQHGGARRAETGRRARARAVPPGLPAGLRRREAGQEATRRSTRYEKAYQLDATYLPALEGFGNLLVQAKRYDEALKVYQTILIHHRDDLTDLEVVEIYWQLGDVHLR